MLFNRFLVLLIKLGSLNESWLIYKIVEPIILTGVVFLLLVSSVLRRATLYLGQATHRGQDDALTRFLATASLRDSSKIHSDLAIDPEFSW